MSPIFQYRCDDCKSDFEEIRKIAKADSPAFCPDCGQQCKQVPAVPGRFVRGSGGWSSPA